ncbi:MAG: 30S ribosomal protein S5 [Chloroflexi bacterium]|nr:30S ribosomal protein S5 [Chloroflexota bacterium]
MEQKRSRIDPTELTLNDKLIYINRVAKVMKGGKRLRFSALVVTGDGVGHVGIGIGKANEVPVAISQGGSRAKKSLIEVARAGSTIPHAIRTKFGAAEVLLKPAAPGTGVIAGSAMRAVLEACGIKDILTKSLGSSNRINVARATLLALSQLKNPREEVARRKGIAIKPESARAEAPASPAPETLEAAGG